MKWSIIIASIGLMSLSGCNQLPDWLGSEEQKASLPGERIALKRASEQFAVEVPLAEQNVQLPPAKMNDSWNQSFGSVTGISDHLLLSLPFTSSSEGTVGDGDDFNTLIIPSPVVENGRIFALDGNGTLSAHDSETLLPIWQSTALEHSNSGDSLLGGGLAVAGEILYAVNDEGKLAAMLTEDGRLLWEQSLKLPLRAAPRMIGKTLLLLSADNQLLALNAHDGEPRWIHQGLNDQASQLQAILPAAGGDMVLATYSSGEVTALALDDGTALWTDMLAGSAQTALQEDRFGAVSALMTPRVSFAGSPKSFTAYATQNGRRIWERRLPLITQPWLTGTTLYVLTVDYQLMALSGSNGRVLWVQDLPSEESGDSVLWQHPIIASDKVWMVSNHGQLRSYSAITGEADTLMEIPNEIAAAPVIANGTLYLLDSSAKLHALR